MITGNACFDFLNEKTKEKDRASSSFWDLYHTNFEYEDGQLSGLQMLGDYQELKLQVSFSDRVIQAIKNILEIPYRKMAYNKSIFKQLDKTAQNIAAISGQRYSLDRLRHTLTLDLLKKYIPGKLMKDSKVCIIGDGFATMASLFLKSQSAGQVFIINLNKSLLVDLYFIKKIMPSSDFEKYVCLVTDKDSLLEAIGSKKKVVAIMANHYELLQYCPVDVAINIASMQEMDMSIIEKYFYYLRTIATEKEIFFYCNNREIKVLPDGSVIRFSEFPWSVNDDILVDELCPWHQKYYSLTPPFYHKFDGSVRHRLVRLSPE